MKINKTAEECIVDNAAVLLKCFVDPNLSIIKKQTGTKWITWFFDYQDAINENNQEKFVFLQKKLKTTLVPSYYKNAFQEFQSANLLYDNIVSLKKEKNLFFEYSTKQINKTINTFSDAFIKTIKSYINLDRKNIEEFQILIYTIQYHLSYIFKNELEQIVKLFIKILKTKVFCQKENSEMLLINIILNENETFFSEIQEIQLTNFIYKLEEIFQEFCLEPNEKIDKKIKDLIFTKPKKINVSMNTLLKENNINFYNEIWIIDGSNEKKAKLLTHLFAYETYFVQGQDNNQIYEELVLKNVIHEEKYQAIFAEYKMLNKIN